MTFYKIVTRPKFKIEKHTNRQEADKTGNDGFVFSSADDLRSDPNTSVSVMAIAYDALVDAGASGSPVKKFKDKKTAARRLFALTEERFSDVQDAAPPQEEATGGGESKNQTTAPSATKSRRGRIGNRAKHVWPTRTTNPYREGSKSHSTFAMILNVPGLTFAEILERGGRANTVSGAIRDKYVELK